MDGYRHFSYPRLTFFIIYIHIILKTHSKNYLLQILKCLIEHKYVQCTYCKKKDTEEFIRVLLFMFRFAQQISVNPWFYLRTQFTLFQLHFFCDGFVKCFFFSLSLSLFLSLSISISLFPLSISLSPSLSLSFSLFPKVKIYGLFCPCSFTI